MKEKEIIVDGVKLAYIERIVDGEKPVFVFLHGWGGNMSNFMNVYNHFVNINILSFDFPGFGHSASLDKSWTLEQYTKITENFIEKMVENKKIILVGHSFGGRVMMKMLANKSKVLKLVQNYIFIGTPFYREDIGLAKKTIINSAKILNTVSSLPLIVKARRPLRKFLYHVIGATDYFELGEDAVMQKTFQNTINHDISKYIKYISKDVAVLIWGANDKIIPISMAERVALETGVLLYRIDSAGHMPFVDNSDGFTKVFNKILEKWKY